MGDWIFYALDIWIFVMLARWIHNSNKIELETKIGAKWIWSILFLVIAVIGYFRYGGWFRTIQTIALAVFAGMIMFVRSGLCDEGIVIMGSLTKWEKAGTLSWMTKENCLVYKLHGRKGALYFDHDQAKDVEKYIRNKHIGLEIM